jgi:hypothetical protein
MKRLCALTGAAALCGALVVSGPASAFGGGFGGGGFHGGGFRGAGFGGGGWRGGGWGGGWRGAGWRGGWNGGWNRWNRWNGWGGNWGWGWGAGLLGAGLGYGLASGWDYPYYGYDYYYPNYYYPNYAYFAPATPLVTGRSVATGGVGDFCATPVRTCQLVHASFVGGGCSCRVAGGRARGSVVP